MSVNIRVHRAFIAIIALIRGLHKSKRIENKTILIVFQQIFGDSVVLQNSLIEYTKIYPKSEGYTIRFIARPSVLSFMQSTMPLPKEIEYEPVDFKRFLEDFGYYRETVKKYKDIAGTLIVPGTSLSSEIFACSSNANKKIAIIRSVDVRKPWIYACFYRLAYNEIIRPEKTEMMLISHRRLVNYLKTSRGIYSGYKAQLPLVLPKEKIVEGEYAVMCPGSSRLEKCWPVDRFAEIADYLVEKYKTQVHFCGGKGEEVFADKVLSASKQSNQFVSHIGMTSFSDWSSIVQHASLVIGNDSATMHLAAAARVPSICIAGAYDKYKFFPYQVDVLKPGDCLPVTLLKDMPCEWCRTIGYDAGYGNEECSKRIKAGLCCSCIDLITVDEVKTAIDKLMREERK